MQMARRVGHLAARVEPAARGLAFGTRRLSAVSLLAALLSVSSGCTTMQLLSVIDYATPQIATVREVPRNPLAQPLKLMSRKGPEPTDRTKQLLRRYDISTDLDGDPQAKLAELQAIVKRENDPDHIYAYSELAYIFAEKARAGGDEELAFDLYVASVVSSYAFLFDPKYDQYRNPYDPQFRRASDLYNGALEGAMRIANADGLLRPGVKQGIKSGASLWDVEVTVNGPWEPEDFDRFEFVSDYEITGLTNRHHTYGLGVPLVARLKRDEEGDPAEQYYPEGVTFPVTAFLRVSHTRDQSENGRGLCKLELYDPVTNSDIWLNDRLAPLETDLSTPLAVFLNHPLLRTNFLATFGLLDANAGQAYRGVYMMEPFDPNKIPVVMVHGLWSSPVTWMQMFNDLRAAPDIRNRYQFWFYLYPTGQPFWISATQMRRDLADMRRNVDPRREAIALDQMILIGHSMGGLVSTMQTLESGNDFWEIISDKPFESLQAEEQTRQQLTATLFFEPNRSVRRVVTIATPHRGSHFANAATRYLGRSLITLPSVVVDTSKQVIKDNPDLFRDTDLLTITTSIDSLAPDSPILPTMLSARHAPWVRYHNIIGDISEDGIVGRLAEHSDGVVSVESARIGYVDSEVVVDADHSKVHSHPRAILEVQRILRLHSQEMLAEAESRRHREFHATFTAPAFERRPTASRAGHTTSGPAPPVAQPAGAARTPRPPAPFRSPSSSPDVLAPGGVTVSPASAAKAAGPAFPSIAPLPRADRPRELAVEPAAATPAP